MSRQCEYSGGCLTCPYPDCISPSRGPMKKKDNKENGKNKPGPKPMDPEMKKQRQREASHRYYLEHREEHAAWAKKYYEKHKEEIQEYQRNYRQRYQTEPRRRSYSIWMTDGSKTERIKPEDYDMYIEKGWWRGRALKPYKLGKE